jgi:O-antigen ligase
MTVTRASWIGFADFSLSDVVVDFIASHDSSSSERVPFPLVLAGVILLQQRRSIGFFDKSDQSTSWREMVWKEGFHLLVSKPRHLIFGVGLDSIKGHWREWGLFDNGRQPIGHMHSNLLQIALERGCRR